MTLPTLADERKAVREFMYWGEREDWLIALTQHRDSDALERSNWEVITETMTRWHPDDVAIERSSHWAVGWVEYLLVRPGTPAVVSAEGWAERLADYPVADEQHYSALEWSEEWCVRCDGGTRYDHEDRDRFRLCRFRSQEEADEIRWRWRHRRDA